MTLEDFTAKYPDCVPAGPSSVIRDCPIHQQQCLSVTEKPDGSLVFFCEQGCSEAMLIQSLGVNGKGGDANEIREYRPEPTACVAEPVSNGHAGGLGTKEKPPSASRGPSAGTNGNAVVSPRQNNVLPSRKQVPETDPLLKVPPNDVNAEMSVLGSILLNPDAIDEVKDLLAADFYRPSHGLIYSAMQACRREGQGIDAVTVTYELKQRGQINETGGAGYIAELAAFVPTALHVKTYGAIVRELSIKRRVAVQARALIQMAENGSSADSVLDKARAIIEIPRTRAALSIICEEAAEAVVSNAEYLSHPAIVGGLYYTHVGSLGCGGKHEGKTTAVRTEGLAIACGQPIYGREVAQTPVVYAVSDDEYPSTRMELLQMGWNPSIPLTLVRIREGAESDDVLEDIAKLALRNQAYFVILDMLFDFAHITDENKYAHTREATAKVQQLADAIKGHVRATHHSPKWMPDAATAAKAALGSQGLAARFSPILLSRQWTSTLYTIESTMTRDPRGEAIKPTKVVKNAAGWIETAGEFKEWMKWEIYAERVMGLFDPERPQRGYDVYEASEKLDLDRSRVQNVFKQLVEDKRLVREKRGRKYSYYLAGSDMFSREGGTFEATSTPNKDEVAVHLQTRAQFTEKNARVWGDEEQELDENGIPKGR